jgi:type I restriction enzyme S subunit
MVDWIEKPIGELFSISGGRSASRAQLSDKGYFYLHYGDIHASTKPYIDTDDDRVNIPRLNVPLNKVSTDSLLQDGDVVFVDASEDDIGASKHIVVRNASNVPFISGLHTIVAKPLNDETDKAFREYCFQTAHVQSQFKQYAAGTKVTGVSKTNIKKITIRYPKSLQEQQAIAVALSDVDGYIAALERLIAKKRNIKEGAMQELLTGKRRLPGFSKEWAEKAIGTFAAVVSGGTPSTFHSLYWGGSIPWMSSGELNLKRVRYVEGRITSAGLENSSTTMLPPYSVLIGLAGQGKTRGTVAMNYFELCTNQSIAAILPSPHVYSSEYLYQNLDNRYDELRELSTGDGGRGGLNLTIIRKLTIPFPELTEQTAIAAVLSDMDAEVDALTAKLSKVRNIKQGIMQELLTGRIRLAVEETETAIVAKPEPKAIELPKRELQPAASQTGGHNQQFDDAVMIAGIVNALYSDKYPLGRKKVQKCLYLLRRHQDESTAAFKKKAAGPYADEVRYRGGEPIARTAKYITTTSTKDKGTTFARGDNISQALAYIKSWGKQDDIKWVADKLKYKKVDELELLATVDMAICNLEEAGTPVSVAAIKHLIATNAEWKAKLKRQIFSDVKIARAIRELQTLLQGGN